MADSMATEVPVKLSDEELLERGENLAVKMLHIETLRDKKKADAKRTQGLIDEELEEAARLARVITGQEEARKQGELFVGDQVASDALAQVGAAACTCESQDVAKVDCPVHGTIPGDGKTATDPDTAETAGVAEAQEPADGSALAADPGPDGNPEDKAEPFPDGGEGEAA